MDLSSAYVARALLALVLTTSVSALSSSAQATTSTARCWSRVFPGPRSLGRRLAFRPPPLSQTARYPSQASATSRTASWWMGLYSNDDAANLPGTYYSQEVLREFQVVTSNATAEFGRAEAGFVNIATQGGTNDFHGRAYGFLRNQRLDAANAFTRSKTPVTWLQYGLTLGGPILKERTFFFTNYERTRNSGTSLVTIAPANVAAVNAVLSARSYPGSLISTGIFPGDPENKYHLSSTRSSVKCERSNLCSLQLVQALARRPALHGFNNRPIATDEPFHHRPGLCSEQRVQPLAAHVQ